MTGVVTPDGDRTLAAREQELAAIYGNVPGILFYVAVEPGGEFRFLSMSRAGLAAMGLSSEQVVGTLVRDVIPPPSRDLVLAHYRDAIRSGETVRWREVSEYPAGQKVGEVAVTPFYDASGAPTHLIGIVHDITDRERLEALRDEEHSRELRLLVETAAQGVVMVNANGLIVTANHAMGAMFGWAPEELIGQPIGCLLPSAFHDVHQQHVSSYFRAPHPRLMGLGHDLVGMRKDRTTFPIEVNLNHVSTSDGGRAIAFVTDVTERRHAAAALRARAVELELLTAQLRRLASDLTLAEQRTRERFASTMHDDLQQVLFGVSLMLMRAEHDAAGSPVAARIAEARGDIEAAKTAARSLSLELLPPVLATATLSAAVGWLAEWMHSKYGLRVDVTTDPRADIARKDVFTLVFESLRELLFNVVKHAHVDHASIDLAIASDAILVITVRDDGAGFDVGELSSKTSIRHPGLGILSIRERLTLLGGRLAIESAPGHGTTCQLIAPVDMKIAL